MENNSKEGLLSLTYLYCILKGIRDKETFNNGFRSFF